MLPGRTQEQKDALSKRIVEAMGEEMDVPPQATWIIYRDTDAGDWFMADKSLAQIKREREAGG
tara:strand:- start:2299 stop:2487 length:189 start_codon:yes stop_codon:yes gene_type:complete